VKGNQAPTREAAKVAMIVNINKLVRSGSAALLAAILVPCLSVAQDNPETVPATSEESGSTAGRVVKAPVHAVGATARALGKLFKPTPSAPSANPKEATGLTSFVQLQGTSTHLGLVTSVTTNIGYNFNSKFGADIGVPIFVARSPFSPYSDRNYSWTALWGDPYVDVHYKVSRPRMNFLSVLTGTIPASTPERVFTTGRAGVDWFNHVETNLTKQFTPFLNFGAANGTVSRYYMPRPYSMARPYQTLGFIADFEGGGQFRLRPGLKVGASVYALVPGGPQKVFSRLVAPGSSVVGDFDHNRHFYHAFQTNSQTHLDLDPDNQYLGSEIARDNGFSAWLEIGKARSATLLIGYTHSVHYAYDALHVNLNFDMTSVIKRLTTPR